MHHFSDPIFVAHHISIADYGDTNMLLELVDTSEICLSCECLFVGPTMYWYQICSSSLESLHEVNKETRIFPAEPSFDRYWYFYSFTHFFDNLECCISIDHQRWSVSAFDYLLRWTSHIDIDPSDTVPLDDTSCFGEHERIFSKYLDDERIFTWIMSECSSLEILGVDESIRRIELWEYNCLRGNPLYNLAIRTITISIHRSESCDRSTSCEIWPELFVHGNFISRKIEKANFSIV